MAYGGRQLDNERIEIDENGNQVIVRDEVEVSPETRHENSPLGAFFAPKMTNLGVFASLGALSGSGINSALQGAGGVPGAGGTVASTAGSTTVPSVAAPVATKTAGGSMFKGLASLFGKGGTGSKLLGIGKTVGGILDKSADNRAEQTRDALYAHQLDLQGARDTDAAMMERAKFERDNIEAVNKQRALNYESIINATRRLNRDPNGPDLSGSRLKIHVPKNPKHTVTEDERAYLMDLRDRAMRDIMNPNMPTVGAYTPAGRAELPKAGWLEKAAGPVSMAMRLFGAQDEDEQGLPRPISRGDAPRPGGPSNA